MIKKCQLKTLEATKKIAKIISKVVNKNFYLLLTGPLASGKTQLTKYIGAELGVKNIINSPSFVILNQYDTKYPWSLIHIDAYRLNKKTNFNEYFELTIDNFSIIEWPEKINWNFKTKKTIFVDFKINKNVREITISTKNLTKEEESQIFNNI